MPEGNQQLASLSNEVPEERVVKNMGKRDQPSQLGLASSWDNTPAVRKRLRSGLNLVCHFDVKLGTLTNCKVERTLPNVKLSPIYIVHIVLDLFLTCEKGI